VKTKQNKTKNNPPVPRPVGRPYSVDKITCHEKAKAMGVDPFEILLLFAKGDWKTLGYESERVLKSSNGGETYEWTIEPNVRMKACSEVCHYLYSKRRSVEVRKSEYEALSESEKLFKMKEAVALQEEKVASLTNVE